MKNKKMKKNKDRALAYGEVTNHSHTVDVDVWEREDGLREFAGPTTVTHQEHKAFTLPGKDFVSGQVMEHDHLKQMERTVRD